MLSVLTFWCWRWLCRTTPMWGGTGRDRPVGSCTISRKSIWSWCRLPSLEKRGRPFMAHLGGCHPSGRGCSGANLTRRAGSQNWTRRRLNILTVGWISALPRIFRIELKATSIYSTTTSRIQSLLSNSHGSRDRTTPVPPKTQRRSVLAARTSRAPNPSRRATTTTPRYSTSTNEWCF